MNTIFFHIDREEGVKETICLDDIVRIYASPETLKTHEEAYVQLRHNSVFTLSYAEALALIQAIKDLS